MITEGLTKKICTRCREEKDLSLFTPSSSGKYGRHSHCKACRSKANCVAMKKKRADKKELS